MATQPNAFPNSTQGLITSEIFPRQVSFCCVTQEELDSYVSWGFFLNACLTLLGVTSSGALTCRLATVQEGLPIVYIAQLNIAQYMLGAISVIFLLGSISFGILQYRSKNRLFGVRNSVPLSKG